jgi:membrane protease YdiL (CAAX protease family)
MSAEPDGEFAHTSPEPRARARPTPAERTVALLEVLLCSDYPTQLALGSTLLLLGVPATKTDGGLSLRYVAALSFLDTAALIGLVLLFLRAHGESARTVLLGRQPLTREFRIGTWLVVPSFLIAGLVLGIILQFAPRLHTVPENPFKGLMTGPVQAITFALVVVIAGGVREEVQRAFLLHRFEGWLGGSTVGIAVTSVVFGMGHLPQGIDAAFATAALGAFWGIVYLRRRSAAAPMVSHAGFNLLQLVQLLAIGR